MTKKRCANHKFPPEMPKSARQRFGQQRANALRRNKVWELTPEQWFNIWISSGKFEQRGKRKNQYVMARINDSGPYSVENVVICTTEDNIRGFHEKWRNEHDGINIAGNKAINVTLPTIELNL